ncbi:MAG: hypothetical protein Q8N72_00845 [Candidatus Omnitrophota bacterium]|nr:hypothetical protein [Candidatus Omnitrophota bacterium]
MTEVSEAEKKKDSTARINKDINIMGKFIWNLIINLGEADHK